jgi:hypothetical protein
MPRFILRYSGKGPKPADDVAQIHGADDVKVIDESARMLLVESSEPSLQQLLESLSQWSATPEQYVPLPDPRVKVSKTVRKKP